MGVQGLWSILESCGQPVSFESLAGKTWAIDVSIWLYQLSKGIRDASGHPVPNAHLSGTFRRICKLLFHGIKPVFVFDGAVPLLKKQTITLRQKRRQSAEKNAKDLRKKIIRKVMQKHALSVLSKTIDEKEIESFKRIMKNKMKESFDDQLFQLPDGDNLNFTKEENEEDENFEEEEKSFDEMNEGTSTQILFNTITNKYKELRKKANLDLALKEFSSKTTCTSSSSSQMDINSELFKNLPEALKLEMLAEMRENSKKHKASEIPLLPKVSDDFSIYQLDRLMKMNQLSRKMDEIREEVNKHNLTSEDHVIKQAKLHSKADVEFVFLKRKNPNEEDVRDMMYKRKKITAAQIANYKEPDKKSLKKTSFLTLYSPPTSNCYFKQIENKMNDKFAVYRASEKNVDMKKIKDNELGLNSFVSDESEEEDEEMIEVKSFEDKSTVPSISFSVSTPTSLPSFFTTPSSEVKNKYNQEIDNQSNFGFLLENKILNNEKQKDINEEKVKSYKEFDANNKWDPLGNELSLEEDEQNKQAHEKEDPEKKTEQQIIGEEFKNIMHDVKEKENSERKENEEVETNRKNEKDETEENKEKLKISLNINTRKEENKKEEEEELKQMIKELVQPLENSQISQENVEKIKGDINEGVRRLEEERSAEERKSVSVGERMQTEVKQLLKLFGVPYLSSPGEAEAQCAFLSSSDQVEGVIGDDNDTLLFGAKKLVKNVFDRDTCIEMYSLESIQNKLLLKRSSLISLALMTGCDYTLGVPGIGPVTALEVLQEFKSDEDFESLIKFRDWRHKASLESCPPQETKLKSKLRKISLPPGFPNYLVFRAFMEPTVDSSTEPFTWGVPDLDALKSFASKTLKWTNQQIKDMLAPLNNKINKEVKIQRSIDTYVTFNEKVEVGKIKSKRMKRIMCLKLSDQNKANKSKKTNEGSSDKEVKTSSKSKQKFNEKKTLSKIKFNKKNAKKKQNVQCVSELNLSEDSFDDESVTDEMMANIDFKKNQI